MPATDKTRCAWVGDQPAYLHYHDTEWGVPLFDDAGLFELLILEGAQAGLNWLTILQKREGYRRALAGFDAAKIARFGPAKLQKLLQDPGIVRNRLKIQAAVDNARAFLKVRRELGSFSDYLWGFVGHEPIKNAWATVAEVPAQTPESLAMSKDLKQRGFKFVGPTICYAFMQAAGLVNDHTVDCFRYHQV